MSWFKVGKKVVNHDKILLLKNKHTDLWDICTNNENNPPLEKHFWAGDFKTKEEAEKYLGDTLKN